MSKQNADFEGLRNGPKPETIRLVNTRLNRIKSDKDEAATDFASEFKRFGEIGGDRDALKMARKLIAKENEDARAFIRNLVFYWRALGGEVQGDLFASDQALEETLDLLNRDQRQEAVHEMGRDAGYMGIDMLDNPHSADTEERGWWKAGWIEGQRLRAEEMRPADYDEQAAKSRAEQGFGGKAEGDGDLDAPIPQLEEARKRRRAKVARGEKVGGTLDSVDDFGGDGEDGEPAAAAQ